MYIEFRNLKNMQTKYNILKNKKQETSYDIKFYGANSRINLRDTLLQLIIRHYKNIRKKTLAKKQKIYIINSLNYKIQTKTMGKSNPILLVVY